MAPDFTTPPNKQSFWFTLPGVIAQVAGLIGAITALLTVLFSHCEHRPDGLFVPTPSQTASPAKFTTVISAQHPQADVSCDQEKDIRSIEGVTQTSFSITNKTKLTVTVYWLNYKGRRQEYLTIAPNQTREIQTYLTHPWLVADPAGKCMGIVYAPADAVIE